jgi:hypothetical protein
MDETFEHFITRAGFYARFDQVSSACFSLRWDDIMFKIELKILVILKIKCHFDVAKILLKAIRKFDKFRFFLR